MWRLIALIFCLSAVVTFSAKVNAGSITGRADIVDGDTIKILGVAIRLNGIDAPESLQECKDASGVNWDCGKAATRALAQLIASNEVRCEAETRDQYDRLLAECFVGSMSLNAQMVREGWAFAFVRYSDQFAGEQDQAEASNLGLWAGTFDYPWDWRSGVALAATGSGENGECVIKGNISSSGERIYHMPFQQFYGRTRISEGKGERWFCTEEQAQVAGWRRALQ